MAKTRSVQRMFSLIFITVIVAVASFGCGDNNAEEPGLPEEQAAPPTVEPTQAPDRVILAATAQVSAEEIAEAQAFISPLAAQSGLEFEIREVINANEITPDVRIIVFLEQPDNLGTLAAGAPNTQFVAISSQDWNPPANGSIIRLNNDHAAFLAGYLSAMVAPNFRVGALQVAEDVAFNQSFANGVIYYCGICAAIVYPLNTYPVTAQVPASSPPANWQAAFNDINPNKVNVLFLPREAASPELAAFLASQDIAVVGNAPPPEELRPRWVATINSDGLTPLQEIWPDLVNGIGGKVINASLKFSDVNFVTVTDGLVWLSQGKMQQIDEMIQLLRDGQIYTYSVMQ